MVRRTFRGPNARSTSDAPEQRPRPLAQARGARHFRRSTGPAHLLRRTWLSVRHLALGIEAVRLDALLGTGGPHAPSLIDLLLGGRAGWAIAQPLDVVRLGRETDALQVFRQTLGGGQCSALFPR